MEKIYIFGHKNPDTDSITSAIVMENLEKKLGNENVVACRLSKLNKETKYVLEYANIPEPQLIENIKENQEVILVDHNEYEQSIEGLENAQILKVVDHHRIFGLKTSYPLYFRAEPVGCTATVLYKLYRENNIEIEKNMALLMLSAIISDTLLFKSPTCTKEDETIANELAKIAQVDINTYGLDMLKAGTDLSDLTPSELINVDLKTQMLNDTKAVISQVNTASIEEMMTRKESIIKEMQIQIETENIDLFIFVITDIINSNSQVIVLGNRIDIFEKAFNLKLENNTVLLPGVVSRKKQIVPPLTNNS